MLTTNYLKRYLRKELAGIKKANYQSLASEEYEHHNGIIITFGNINFRFPEIVNLYISIPQNILEVYEELLDENITFFEDYLLRQLSSIINEYGKELRNESKEVRSHGDLKAQIPDSKIIKRTGLIKKDDYFVLKTWCRLPLIGINTTNGKSACRMITDILKIVSDWMNKFDPEKVREHLELYLHQKEIREIMKNEGIVCFIKNDSVLPRDNKGSSITNAIPFTTPKETYYSINLSDGTRFDGMAIKKGLTVITGGGYSGKSTLLDAIESGIYNHIKGDGREYVLTDSSAFKAYAEDGRPVDNLDMSPFFKGLLNGQDVKNFSTEHASGSISQAANIIEAIYSGTKLLLIDEDKSATNFLIRDELMRKTIKNEPIIPFTDRVYEIKDKNDVSIIMVIGAISEYFYYADRILLADEYRFCDITNKIELGKKVNKNCDQACWTKSKKVSNELVNKSNCFFKTIQTENNRKIILDEYSADVMLLTAINSSEQLNSLAFVAEQMISKEDHRELKVEIEEIIYHLFSDTKNSNKDKDTMMILERKDRWYEEVRVIDALCCMFRMRNIKFK